MEICKMEIVAMQTFQNKHSNQIPNQMPNQIQPNQLYPCKALRSEIAFIATFFIFCFITYPISTQSIICFPCQCFNRV